MAWPCEKSLKMDNCKVCGVETECYGSSPFAPFSYTKCKECLIAKRLSYDDLLTGGSNKNSYDKLFGEEYFLKYFNASLPFYGKTEEQFWQDVAEWKIKVQNIIKESDDRGIDYRRKF